MTLLKGVLKNAFGETMPNHTIVFTALKNTQTVLNTVISEMKTDDNGAYEKNIYQGRYQIDIYKDGIQKTTAGIIELYADSPDADINTYLTLPGEAELTPEFIQQVIELKNQAVQAADSALALATEFRNTSDKVDAEYNEIKQINIDLSRKYSEVLQKAKDADASSKAASASESNAKSYAESAIDSRDKAKASEDSSADSSSKAKDSETKAKAYSDKLDKYIPSIENIVYVEQFMVAGESYPDDTIYIQRALDSDYKRIDLKPGKIYTTKTGFNISKEGKKLHFNGAKIKYLKTDATYYHCIRILNSDCALYDPEIFCDSSLVRNDTGFGILIANAYYTQIFGGNISDIASAAIWCEQAFHTNIIGTNVYNPKADGIHFTDGCYSAYVQAMVSGAADDSFAAVSDIPGDNRNPVNIIFDGCRAMDNKTGHGHGVVLIGAIGCNVTSCTFRGLLGPAIGGYFWNVTGTPKDDDWTQDCLISGCIIESCALSPMYAQNNTPIYVGGMKRTRFTGNKVQGCKNVSALGAPGNCVLIANQIEVSFDDNLFHDSPDYGIACLDSSTSEKASFDKLLSTINTFKNIDKDYIHLAPAASEIGSVRSVNDILINTPANAAWGRSMYVSKTRANLLAVVGSKNIDTKFEIQYDALTCTNVNINDNTPAVNTSWTPTLTAGSGSISSATATGKYYCVNNTLFFSVTINLTNPGTAAGSINVSLPKAIKSGSPDSFPTGREDAVSGKSLIGKISGQQLMIFSFDNGSFIAAGAKLVVTGSYQI